MIKKITSALVVFCFLFFPPSYGATSGELIEQFSLQFNTTKDCDAETYCATIQIRGGEEEFTIGTSSIFFTYNSSALTFFSYKSLNFDGSAMCIFESASAWEPHAYDGTSIPGSFNLTLEIPSGQFSCPTISSDWIDIGEVCFDVMDDTQTGNLVFSESNTNFNRGEPNDGSMAIARGSLFIKDESLACAVCPAQGTACDDGDDSTTNDIEDGNCNCAGTPCPTQGMACDDGDDSTTNDIEDGNCNCAGTPCPTQGTTCDDGDDSTTNDIEDGNCNCAGTPCPAQGTACDDGDDSTTNDIEDGNCNCSGTPCPTQGTACDDGDDSTTNDIEDGNCNCAGTPCPAQGTACDDGDDSTTNDIEDGNCNCSGTPCPAQGTACDDGDDSTTNDMEDGNCNCAGTTPNCPEQGTACDDGNDATTNDTEDGNCNCIGTPCPTQGTACDDGNDATTNDTEDGNCNCIGTPCPTQGTACDDGNDATTNDVEDGNCNCAGSLSPDCPPAGTPCSDGDLTTINDRYDDNCNCKGDVVLTSESVMDVQLQSDLNCDNDTYCVTLRIKAQGREFSIGNSSIQLNYNAQAIQFDTYQSLRFDENEDCSDANSWMAHTVNTDRMGAVGVNLSLTDSNVDCPSISNNTWEDLGTICFNIITSDASPNIIIDSEHTQFSVASSATEQIALGTLTNITHQNALSCDQSSETDVISLSAKVFLQGAFNRNTQLMSDDLRTAQYLPLQEPYTNIPTFVHISGGGGEMVTSSVLNVSGNDAIVDWIFVELRSSLSAGNVVATRSGLLQRDGDIVDVDGVSPLNFNINAGSYYVIVKHRNHLGAATANALNFTANNTVSIDFTSPMTATFGTNAQKYYEDADVNVLWGGNANQDKYLILVGGGFALPDRDHIFFELFLNIWNGEAGAEISYNSILDGYYHSDTNMDGQIRFQGPKNDIDALIFFNVLSHPNNTRALLNYIITEQIP